MRVEWLASVIGIINGCVFEWMAWCGFTDRIGLQPFEAMASELAHVGALGPETQDLYTDWSKSETYKLERGEGECAA